MQVEADRERERRGGRERGRETEVDSKIEPNGAARRRPEQSGQGTSKSLGRGGLDAAIPLVLLTNSRQRCTGGRGHRQTRWAELPCTLCGDGSPM